MASSPPRCPRCGVDPGFLPRGCPGCGLLFRWVPAAVLMSIALPGWGHFYLGRRLLAGVELAGGLLLFLLALARLASTFLAILDERAVPLDLLWACLRWAPLLIAYSILDGLFTLAVSSRRLAPASPIR